MVNEANHYTIDTRAKNIFFTLLEFFIDGRNMTDVLPPLYTLECIH